jgi:pyruvate,water dikinase
MRLLSLTECLAAEKTEIGGKAFSLARLFSAGFTVPETVCIPCSAYRAYLTATGLGDRISDELSRRPLDAMRWEELWDVSLRIRSLFLRTPIPRQVAAPLTRELTTRFAATPLVIRSSAPSEDSDRTSFAGLHDSFVDIRGKNDVLKHIRLVWASLWSDRTLLYRRELGLDPSGSAMAVLVQRLVPGHCSGVLFTANPLNESEMVVEAVSGLNEQLVDGTTQPERWVLDRESGRVLLHTQPAEGRPPHSPALLDTSLLKDLHHLGSGVESLFSGPQDIEWTMTDSGPVVLQARPVTTAPPTDSTPPLWQEEDKRPWYLSLHRSIDNLRELRRRIETDLLPEMDRDAQKLHQSDPGELSDRELAAEIRHRLAVFTRWNEIYWNDFIPFAHAIRIFGRIYNETMAPEDPYEFMNLLTGTKLEGVQRNSLLEELAAMVRGDPSLARRLKEDLPPEHALFEASLERFVSRFGDLSCSIAWCTEGVRGIVRIILEIAAHPPRTRPRPPVRELEAAYLDSFPLQQRSFALEMLELGRAGYRLRDDDNIHLGKIEGPLLVAMEEGKQRLGPARQSRLPAEEIARGLEDPAYIPRPARRQTGTQDGRNEAGPITGQPAGPGLARGPARVVDSPEDLFAFQSGEILVCRAVDPNMTFVAPLAAGVVEERGGMLIHGAIIAREYGLPCVTGATGILLRVKTGDTITVDGFRGQVLV